MASFAAISLDEFVDTFLNMEVLRRAWPFLLSGLAHTIMLAVIAFTLALFLGGLVALGRSSRSWVIRRLTIIYVDVMRALPPLVVLMVAFYVIPSLGVPLLTPLQAAAISLGLIQSAFVGEIYRGGILAVEAGQTEAGMSVGLGRIATGRYVIAPQVIRVIIPPLTNQATQVTRDSALAFFVGYPELLKQARQVIGISHNMTPLTAAAVLFAIMLIGLQILSVRAEKHFYSQASSR